MCVAHKAVMITVLQLVTVSGVVLWVEKVGGAQEAATVFTRVFL